MSKAYLQKRLNEIAIEIRQETLRENPRRFSITGTRAAAQPTRYLEIPRVITRARASVPPDADVWTPPSVCLLTVEELLQLPRIEGGARRPGVYFLFLESVLQYVGSSRNVRTRVCGHDLYRDIKFDKATYLAIPEPWHMAIEALYICTYCPPQNSTFSTNLEPPEAAIR